MKTAMKIPRDEIESGDVTDKKPKQTQIFDQIVNTPGLQHIIELVFFNLDFEDLLACQLVNKASNGILENPMFWLKKWRFNKGLSKKNLEDWIKALQITKNTIFERNVDLYIKKVIKVGHFVDVPCYIDNDVMTKATEISFEEALQQEDAGVLQILSPMARNVNASDIKLSIGNIDVVKVLAPLTKNPNGYVDRGYTPIFCASRAGKLDVIQFLASLTENPNAPNSLYGWTPIHGAAINGYLNVIKFLAALAQNPNAPL